eukprot:FR736269.1.p1 GENE.FR736269.1~~FR736269.1.p1  ORF type:complete len:139 (-),score=2.30 FR736269.1:16-432(-)
MLFFGFSPPRLPLRLDSIRRFAATTVLARTFRAMHWIVMAEDCCKALRRASADSSAFTSDGNLVPTKLPPRAKVCSSLTTWSLADRPSDFLKLSGSASPEASALKNAAFTSRARWYTRSSTAVYYGELLWPLSRNLSN